MEHVFQVQGMTCGHCERAVKQAVAQIDAQATTTVDLATGRVVVQSSSTREVLAQAIQEEGYTVA
ncbi:MULTISPECIES: heavy-metal-associated domain-containing protein [Comamonas]|uniref:Cation transporter n=1 Tax=Comamonas aquatica TaxID=225991 RepID=A0AA43AV81_9BURK|nr:cation transporter [Comamonas aquatica]MDE1555021.1 cation transporter [Comamonas aquatica]MDH0372227.1 cation transporter [Comamonas aquatica]MDH1426799.1 cation transporter [Comamonas aquatica]MDH1604276.1 cation transporter [Comamonas aquatica]MDH1616168.1 cation transporter [Comamonas aquatica]